MAYRRRATRTLILSATLLAASATPALAGTIQVTSQTDDGIGCTLREAVAVAQTGADANDCTGATAGGNTVQLAAATYTVTTPVALTGAVTVQGAGAAQSFVSGGGTTRVFDIPSPESIVVLRDLAVIAGKATDGASGTAEAPPGVDGEPGGGLRNAGNLTLERVTMSGNAAGNGGQAYNAAGAQSRFPRGSSDSFGGDGGNGGAIDNAGTLRLIDSSLVANTGGIGGAGVRQTMGLNGDSGFGGDGGGIANTGTLTADAATEFTGNAGGLGGGGGNSNGGGNIPSGTGGTGGNGGAIANLGSGSTTLNGTRIAGNFAGAGGNGGGCAQNIRNSNGGIGGSGGGVYSGGSGQVTVSNAVIEDNRAGNGGSGNEGMSNAGQGAIGGDAGAGGSGGGVATGPGARTSLTGVTLDQNLAGDPGVPGEGQDMNGGTGQPGEPASAGDGGGAFISATGTLSLQASVVARNSAGRQVNGAPAIGRGDAVFAAGNAGIVGTTLIANVPADGAPGGTGIDTVLGSSVALTASLTSGNGGAECAGEVFNGGGNLSFGTAPCGAASTADPQLPALGAAADPLPLLLPAATSPALDLAVSGTGACGGLDQRGAERPQGNACDAGAVERLGNAESAATALTQVSATIAGRANSEADGTVQLYFGPNAQSLTPVGAPLPVTGGQVAPVAPTAQLSGLAPATTYAIQARIEGAAPQVGPVRTFTTLGPDPTPTPTPAVTATPVPVKATVKLGRLKATSKALSARLTCSGAPCAVRLDATTRVRKKGKKVTGVTLTTRRTKAFRVAKPATRTLRAGQQATVKLKLTKSARKLLTRFHKLPVRVTVKLAGKRVTSATVTAKPAKTKRKRKRG